MVPKLNSNKLFSIFALLAIFLITLTLLSACSSDGTNDSDSNTGVDNDPLDMNKNPTHVEDSKDSVVDDEIDFTISDKAKEIINERFIENDIYMYNPSFESETIDVALSSPNVIDVNSFNDLPEGNIMKVHSVCYDESLDQAYAVGILTEYVAVIKNGKVTDYINSYLDEGDYNLKYLYCGSGLLFVASDTGIAVIDGKTYEHLGIETFSKDLYPQTFAYDSNSEIFAINFPGENEIFFYDGRTFEQLKNIDVVRPFIDFTKEEVVVVTKAGLKSYNVQRYSSSDLSLISQETFSTDNYLSDFRIIEDTGDMYFIDSYNERLEVHNIDNLQAEAIYIEGIVPEPNWIDAGSRYLAVITDNGFDDGEQGFLGGISVIDSKDHSVLYNKAIPFKHESVSIDSNNKEVYITNNDGGSISQIDLLTGDFEIIDIGSAAEFGTVLSDGSIYLQNRLGGSTVMHISADGSEKIHEMSLGNWPLGMVYDERLDQIFMYQFLDGQIAVIDTTTDKVVDIFSTVAKEGNTDALGTMTYDYTRNVLYPVIPEQNRIVAIDAFSGELLANIELADYGIDYAEDLSGAGDLLARIYEPTMTLFVYVDYNQKLYVYDGLDDFKLLDTINLPSTAFLDKYHYGIYMDNYDDKLYLGNLIYDAVTFEYLGKLEHGQTVVAIDHKRELMITVEEDHSDQEVLHVIDIKDGASKLLDSIDLDANQFVNARFAYDQNNAVVYAFYLITGEVWQVSLE